LQNPDGGPTGIFRCRGEDFIAIMVMPYQWKQMIKAMDMPELADDPRFNTARARRDNNVALKHVIEGWLAGFPSRDAVVAALEMERVLYAPVLTVREAVVHPHLRQRGTVRRVRDETIGAFDIPGLPVKFSRWAERPSRRA
jgi:crotonobetainyl-CoA:carnitine CoA-transferase CaiB-like acyl-CoA transferase